MTFLSLLLIALGLSMDAFAVCVSNALCFHRLTRSQILTMAATFGMFQTIMPLAGYFFGKSFLSVIAAADHWIAFALLALVGLHMIVIAIRDRLKGESSCRTNSCTFRRIFIQGIATSIDAFAVGVGLAALEIHILSTVLIIGITTFVCSIAGVWIGKRFRGRLQEYAEMVGGTILIGIGFKILIDGII
jgi:manganese efflux pump family protein